MSRLLLLLLACAGAAIRALAQPTQVQDRFSGSTLDTAWHGDRAAMAVYGGWLNLEAVAPGRSGIMRLAPLRDTATWSLALRLDLDPSSQNQTLLYLATNTPDLASPSLEGWALRVGENGARDGLALCAIRGGQLMQRYVWLPRALRRSPAVRLELSRSRRGLWRLRADTAGVGILQDAGVYADSLPMAGLYAGLEARYTTSHLRHYHWDDFAVSPLSYAPAENPVRQVICTGSRIRLRLATPLPTTARADTAALRQAIAPGWATGPAVAQVVPSPAASATCPLCGPATLEVRLADTLPAGRHSLRIGPLPAPGGGYTAVQTVDFACLPLLRPEELRLSEVKPGSGTADAALAPPAEFVELEATPTRPAWMEGYTLEDETGLRHTIPPDSLLPSHLRLLAAYGDTAAFSRLGLKAQGMALPRLNDTGDELILRDATGLVADRLAYAPKAWATADDIPEYSLERRPPTLAACAGLPAWGTSHARAGATPGQPSSLAGVDTSLAPRLAQAWLGPRGDTLYATFIPQADSTGSLTQVQAALEPAITLGTPAWQGRRLAWPLAASADSAQWYRLRLSGVPGCSRAMMKTGETAFGQAALPDSGRLVINEVMYWPAIGGADFVELYNPTRTYVRLDGLRLIITSASGPDTMALPTTQGPLAPGAYLLLARSLAPLQRLHPRTEAATFRPCPLPALVVDGAALHLETTSGRRLEGMAYGSYTPATLLQESGYALERVSATISPRAVGNWQASAAPTHATPGYANSVTTYTSPGGAGPGLVADPPVFSPNADGQADQVRLSAGPEGPTAGMLGHLALYTAEGRPVRTLIASAPASAGLQALWDGRSDQGLLLPPGPYIALAELWTPTGKTIRLRTVVTIVNE